jgi:hypothetical protein
MLWEHLRLFWCLRNRYKMSTPTNNFLFAKKKKVAWNVLYNVWLLSFEPGTNPGQIQTLSVLPGPEVQAHADLYHHYYYYLKHRLSTFSKPETLFTHSYKLTGHWVTYWAYLSKHHGQLLKMLLNSSHCHKQVHILGLLNNFLQ